MTKNQYGRSSSDWLRHHLKPFNGIQRNLTGSKISTSSTKFLFSGPIGKPRLRPRLPIGSYIFDFSSKTTERNSTKLDRRLDRNVLYQVFLGLIRKPRWPPCPIKATFWRIKLAQHFWKNKLSKKYTLIKNKTRAKSILLASVIPNNLFDFRSFAIKYTSHVLKHADEMKKNFIDDGRSIVIITHLAQVCFL